MCLEICKQAVSDINAMCSRQRYTINTNTVSAWWGGISPHGTEVRWRLKYYSDTESTVKDNICGLHEVQ